MPEGNKIIFFDQLPWFDTYASHFISALEHFWNDWASYRSDIKLIACGSATTWMLNQVINSRRGPIIASLTTPHGLYNNMYARKINRQVTGDDLF